jgi:hypothetical protein
MLKLRKAKILPWSNACFSPTEILKTLHSSQKSFWVVPMFASKVQSSFPMGCSARCATLVNQLVLNSCCSLKLETKSPMSALSRKTSCSSPCLCLRATARQNTLVALLKSKQPCDMGCSQACTKLISIPPRQKHLLPSTLLVYQKRRPPSECRRLSKITNARNIFLARSQITAKYAYGLVSRFCDTYA